MKLSREENERAAAALAIYEELLMGIACKRMRVGVSLEDLLQVGRVATMRALETYNPAIGTEKGWVSVCAANAILDFVRRAHSTIRIPKDQFGRVWRDTVPLDAPCTRDGTLTLAETLPAEPWSGDGEPARQEESRLLQAALQGLPEREQVVIQAWYFEGITLREIGERYGYSTQNAQQITTNAIKRLRRSPHLRELMEGRAA